MKKTLKPNISPLEVEIENKMSLDYLFSIAAKTPNLKIGEIYMMIRTGNIPLDKTDKRNN